MSGRRYLETQVPATRIKQSTDAFIRPASWMSSRDGSLNSTSALTTKRRLPSADAARELPWRMLHSLAYGQHQLHSMLTDDSAPCPMFAGDRMRLNHGRQMFMDPLCRPACHSDSICASWRRDFNSCRCIDRRLVTQCQSRQKAVGAGQTIRQPFLLCPFVAISSRSSGQSISRRPALFRKFMPSA